MSIKGRVSTNKLKVTLALELTTPKVTKIVLHFYFLRFSIYISITPYDRDKCCRSYKVPLRKIRPLMTFNFVKRTIKDFKNVHDIPHLHYLSKTFTCSSKVTLPNIRKGLNPFHPIRPYMASMQPLPIMMAIFLGYLWTVSHIFNL